MKRCIIAIILALTIQNAHAQNFALSLKPSTLGIGIEAIRSFGPAYNARIGYSYFTYDYYFDGEDDYVMDSTLKMSTASALFDWFPFEGVFHLSTGLYINMNDAVAVLTPKESHDVGGRIYTPDMLGDLSANISFNKAAPYLGIGFGNADGDQSGFTFDFGALYQGAPKVDLTASGLLEPSTEQAPLIESNMEWFNFYPVVSVGYLIKF